MNDLFTEVVPTHPGFYWLKSKEEGSEIRTIGELRPSGNWIVLGTGYFVPGEIVLQSSLFGPKIPSAESLSVYWSKQN